MEHWWDEIRWLRRHALLAPFGVFAATMLLTWEMEQWQWHGRSSWALAMTLVDMGAVLYGMAAVAAERSVRLMFWAWNQHQKERAKLREEGRKESAAKIQELEEANRDLQARISDLESRRGRPYRRALRRQRTV